MTDYALTERSTLVVSIDGNKWRTVTFSARDFTDINAATAAEVASVLKRAGVPATVDAGKNVVLESPTTGATSSLDVDVSGSTSAPALGLGAERRSAVGVGPRPARLESGEADPYALPSGAQMKVTVDGRGKRVVFNAITAGRASAEEVVDAINAVFSGAASVTRSRRVAIASPAGGGGASVKVEPAVGPRKVDAAGILGFVGPGAAVTAAAPTPGSAATSARLVCPGARKALQVRNLTASPIQFLMVTRSVVLPAGGVVTISPAEAAHRPLQRLIERGAVQLVWTLDSLG